jgi:hypothetical protein
MFEDLFSYPKVLARHRTGPSANPVRDFWLIAPAMGRRVAPC